MAGKEGGGGGGGGEEIDNTALSQTEQKRVEEIWDNADFQKIKNVLVRGKRPELVKYDQIFDNEELRSIFGGTNANTKIWYAIVEKILEEVGLTKDNFRGTDTGTMKPSVTLVAFAAKFYQQFSASEQFDPCKNPPTAVGLVAYSISTRVALLALIGQFAERDDLSVKFKIPDPFQENYPQDTGHGWKGNPFNPCVPARCLEKNGMVPGTGLYEALRKIEDSFTASGEKRHLSKIWVDGTDGAVESTTSLRQIYDLYRFWQKNRDAKKPPTKRARAIDNGDSDNNKDRGDGGKGAGSSGGSGGSSSGGSSSSSSSSGGGDKGGGKSSSKGSTYLTGLKDQLGGLSGTASAITTAASADNKDRIEGMALAAAAMATSVTSAATTQAAATTAAATTAADAVTTAAAITARSSILTAAIAATTAARGPVLSPARPAGNVANARQIMQHFKANTDLPPADQDKDRMVRFLTKSNLVNPELVKEVSDASLDLDSLLDWATGVDKAYFNSQLQSCGFGHAAYSNRLYKACYEAVTNPNALT